MTAKNGCGDCMQEQNWIFVLSYMMTSLLVKMLLTCNKKLDQYGPLFASNWQFLVYGQPLIKSSWLVVDYPNVSCQVNMTQNDTCV